MDSREIVRNLVEARLAESVPSSQYRQHYKLNKSGWLTDEEGNRHQTQRKPFSSVDDAKKFLAKTGHSLVY
jgi:hypothetical protein